jgi:hypothetical protein
VAAVPKVPPHKLKKKDLILMLSRNLVAADEIFGGYFSEFAGIFEAAIA